MVRMGIVGGRFGASFPFDKHPLSTVEAVCDLREDRRRALQETYGAPRACERYEHLLADDAVDAVGLFTPAPTHAAMAVQALRAGKHVLSAVPAAVTLDECRELIRAVQETGLTYMMAETSYYYPEIMACRRWREDGVFGTIFYAEGEYLHDKTELRQPKPTPGLLRDENLERTWRWGFAPMHYITHSSSGIISVMGERLSAVAALGWADMSDERLRPVMEDNPYRNPFADMVALFKTSAGHAARVAELRWLAAPSTVRFEFYGTERSFVDPPPGRSAGYVVLHPDETAEEWKPDFRLEDLPEELRPAIDTGHAGSHPHIVHEFVSAVSQGRRPTVDVYEAVAYTAPGICAHESALRGGEWVPIPDFGKAAQ